MRRGRSVRAPFDLGVTVTSVSHVTSLLSDRVQFLVPRTSEELVTCDGLSRGSRHGHNVFTD